MVTDLTYSSAIAQAIEQIELPSSPRHLYDPIRYILGLSGKRIRPMLVMYGAEVFGHMDMDEVMPAALAIEFFHNFSLIHDDIMDKAPLRRGAKTVHTKWNDNVAILSGDALLIKAYDEIAKCPADKIASLLKVFNRLAFEVCEGQQSDMDFEAEEAVSEEAYIAMIRAKTSVLLGGALKIGAVLAGADTQGQENIYDFGVNLGIAFQLQDDILDVYGDPENFGKQVGGDILSDKKTILQIKLAELVDNTDRSLLQDIQREQQPDRKIDRTRTLYAKYGIREQADELKEWYSNKAFASLDAIQVADDRKENLYNLAKKLMVRTY